MSVIIGECKECPTVMGPENEIKEHKGLYECPGCGHPHNFDDIVPLDEIYDHEEASKIRDEHAKWEYAFKKLERESAQIELEEDHFEGF